MPPKVEFGRWTLNIETAALETIIAADTGAKYQVPLGEMTDLAHLLDWIYQISEKTWASSADVGDFVAALRSIFGRDICGGGVDKPIDAKKNLIERFGVKFQ